MANGQFAPGVRGLLQSIALQKLQQRDPLRQLQMQQLEQEIAQQEELGPVTIAGRRQAQKLKKEEEKRRAELHPIDVDRAVTGAEQAEVSLEEQQLRLGKTARTHEEEFGRFKTKKTFETDEAIRLKKVPTAIRHITDPKTGTTRAVFPAIAENTRQAMMGQMFEQIKSEVGDVEGEGFLGLFKGDIDEEKLNEMLNTGNFPEGLSPRAVNLIKAYGLVRNRADITARASSAPPEVQEHLVNALSSLALTGKEPEGFSEQEQINVEALINAGFSREEAVQATIGRRKK